MADPFEPPTARPFLEFRLLLHALGIASDARKLILAAAGLVALIAGWSALDRAFGGPVLPLAPVLPGAAFDDIPATPTQVAGHLAWHMTEPFRVVVAPFAALFSRSTEAGGPFRAALMAAWAVAVWGIFGGAIARIAVVQATGGERVGIGTALRFALKKSASLIGAPLTPILGVAVFAAFCGLFGLLYRIPWGIGAAVASVLGFVPLVIGLVMALILLGLALGWPLMHATVAAEGEDAPDALSRSYSYVNQRLPRYASHVAAAWAIGSIGLLAAIAFARCVLALSDWGVALGAPSTLPTTGLAASGRLFWTAVVGMLVHGWIYSYFWSAASVIYLILRRDVDGTDWHDVYMPEHESDTFAGDVGPPAPVEVAKGIEAEVA
jgi:hypothetical protein